MTYCVGMLLDKGLVMAADTRTNAGVDNVGKFKKLYTWEYPGDRVFVLLTAGNLAVTQAVVSMLSEHELHPPEEGETLKTATTMFQAAHVVGNAIREVKAVDEAHLTSNGEAFAASFIFGGTVRPFLISRWRCARICRSTVSTRSAPAVVTRSATSLAEIGTRG